MNLSSAVRTAKSVITANSPVLLVGTAVAGVVATGVLAARGGYKARGIIDEAWEEKGEDLTTTEKIQLTWLCYAAPVLTGASTIASVVGVHTIHTKRHAALAGLYAVTTSKLDDYREKAEEMLGPKKSQDLNNAVAQDAVNRSGSPDNHEVIVLPGGTELCYDDWSGRYFMGSIPIIERAFAALNLKLVEEGDCNLNEFYDNLGLTPIPMGVRFGWHATKVSPRIGSVKTPDGRSAISFGFHKEPHDLAGVS